MPKFAGIDPSLTGTGVVTFDTGTGIKKIASFSSSPSGDSVIGKHSRLTDMSNRIVGSVVEGGFPVLVAIEGPAFSSNTGKAWDRAGLWWYVVDRLIHHKIPVLEVPPTVRAKYGSGSGRAGKDEVLLATSRTYPDFDIKNNNDADALLLCAFAARLAGHPFDGSLPKLRLAALDKFEKDETWVV